MARAAEEVVKGALDRSRGVAGHLSAATVSGVQICTGNSGTATIHISV